MHKGIPLPTFSNTAPDPSNFNIDKGWKFDPQDDEIIEEYLVRKVTNPNFHYPLIKEEQVYKSHPSTLVGLKSGFFFTEREKGETRAAENGKYVISHKNKEITNSAGEAIGKKRHFKYCPSTQEKDKTDHEWYMHEYLARGMDREIITKLVVCKIYCKVGVKASKGITLAGFAHTVSQISRSFGCQGSGPPLAEGSTVGRFVLQRDDGHEQNPVASAAGKYYSRGVPHSQSGLLQSDNSTMGKYGWLNLQGNAIIDRGSSLDGRSNGSYRRRRLSSPSHSEGTEVYDFHCVGTQSNARHNQNVLVHQPPRKNNSSAEASFGLGMHCNAEQPTMLHYSKQPPMLQNAEQPTMLHSVVQPTMLHQTLAVAEEPPVVNSFVDLLAEGTEVYDFHCVGTQSNARHNQNVFVHQPLRKNNSSAEASFGLGMHCNAEQPTMLHHSKQLPMLQNAEQPTMLHSVVQPTLLHQTLAVAEEPPVVNPFVDLLAEPSVDASNLVGGFSEMGGGIDWVSHFLQTNENDLYPQPDENDFYY